jgi:hypothetical protein
VCVCSEQKGNTAVCEMTSGEIAKAPSKALIALSGSCRNKSKCEVQVVVVMVIEIQARPYTRARVCVCVCVCVCVTICSKCSADACLYPKESFTKQNMRVHSVRRIC